MGKTIFDISMSLDGYVTAPNQTREQPLGDEGERLHSWAFSHDPVGQEVLTKGVLAAGAVVCGRRTYDDSIPYWGPDGPTGDARLPVFVVTHDRPVDPPGGGVYRFVTGGIEAALGEAQAAAGEREVSVMGGANVGQQVIRGRLADELSIHLVPVMFGGGTRLFENLGEELRELEVFEVLSGASATHLRYRLR
jgi:dihydrofolate reductase